MKKYNISLQVLLLILIIPSNQQESLCEITGLKLLAPSIKALNELFSNQQLDQAFTHTLIILMQLKKLISACDLPIILNDQIGPELSVNECLKLIDEIKEITADFEFHNNYMKLNQQLQYYSNSCLPFKLGSLNKAYANGGNDDGSNCLYCGFIVTLIDNYVNHNQLQMSDILDKKDICKIFNDLRLMRTCEAFIIQITPIVIQKGLKTFNSDVICQAVGYCVGEYAQCKLHPKSSPSIKFLNDIDEYSQSIAAPWDWIIHYINKQQSQHLPVFDLDGDTFSDYSTLRGFDWKGKDCNELNQDVYPGRNIPSSSTIKGTDYNCNGIFGFDLKTQKTWKQILCDDTGEQGTIVIGDSAGAHFSIPSQYVDVTQWQKHTFDDFFYKIGNEFDLPHLSFGTGWIHNELVNSIYQENVKRNLCNRGDYQNLGVNGQSSRNSLEQIKYSLHRNTFNDKPALVIFELIGNDVCTKNQESMTQPSNFKENILEIWSFLDTKLPKGSHIIVLGVADGRVLYDTLSNKIHPIGIDYNTFYNFLNCNKKSPCHGWMNTDSDIRDATSKRAMELNQIYKDIIKNHSFNNFDVAYYDLPQEKMFQIAETRGYTRQQCLEPVDGFHPSQIADLILSEIINDILINEHPDWLSQINKQNTLIQKMFPAFYH